MSMLETSPKGQLLRRIIEFVFGFENKRGELLDHWISFADEFSLSPQEFYTSLEEQLAARKIPSMTISREEFSEGGLLSDRRIHLRLMRERLVCDTCAAPFGKTFFFSCRTVYVPALVRLWHILVVLFVFSIIGSLLLNYLGVMYGVLAIITLPFALAGVLRSAAAEAISDLDAFILRIPVVATIYENWFREETYFREDTRLLYLKILPNLIRELAEDSVAAKGVKLQPQYKRTPIFTDLYKRIDQPEETSED